MPLAAAGVGFGMTLLLLGTLWALMCYTALLLLEVYQHVPADTGLGSPRRATGTLRPVDNRLQHDVPDVRPDRRLHQRGRGVDRFQR